MKILLSAALLALAPIAASATTVDIPVTGAGFGSFVGMVNPGEQLDFDFDVTAPTGYNIKFVFSMSGSGLYDDVLDVDYNVAGGPMETWDSVDLIAGIVGAGAGTDDGLTTDSDFLVSFYDGVSAEVGITLTYFATLVPVPVPATLPLMAAGLGALGIARKARRKAK